MNRAPSTPLRVSGRTPDMADAGLECALAESLLDIAQELSAEKFDAAHAGACSLEVARRLVPGCEWVSLTKRGYRGYATVMASDPPAELMDALQYAAAAGPSITALESNAAVVVDDVAGDERWPDLAASITGDTAVRAVYSQPLAPSVLPSTSLNLYSSSRGAFGSSTWACLSAAVVTLTAAASAQRTRADNLVVGMRSRESIAAAVGILMHRYRLTYEQGFDELRLASQYTHRKLRDIAEDVLVTGALPEQVTGP